MQTTDYLCDKCGASCAACTIDGVAVPLVAYMVIGTPPSYDGPPFNLNTKGVKLPAIVREIMAQPIARREWCVKCFAASFGLELVEAPQAEDEQ